MVELELHYILRGIQFGTNLGAKSLNWFDAIGTRFFSPNYELRPEL